ncbi:hypothetical protein DPMN_162935 [Dreissena polymorpha]|uniref:Uncharacterized protein n=1 Tax=Dreissena polymorpha TaxID=45954 RepID=A0A9D4IUS0_DREPO|nr:hypothetical protein DPMN_162935 [Dreissena polymorpha]
MYGCELWNNCAASDVARLDSAHRFCIKHMQSLHKSISTDYCMCVSNASPIETYMDCSKLKFIGQLCILSPKYLVKDVFHNRLLRYMNLENQRVGFMADVYRLLGKYGLLQFLNEYIETGLFPTKFTWKMIIDTTVNLQAKLDVAQRHLRSDQYNLLENVIKPDNGSPLWDIARANPNLLTACPFSQKCSLCNLILDNITVHLMCFCTTNDAQRNRLWERVFNRIGIFRFTEFMSMSALGQTVSLLKLSSENENGRFSNFSITMAAVQLLKVKVY